MNELHLGFY